MIRSSSKDWDSAVKQASVEQPESMKDDEVFRQAYAKFQREKYEWIKKTAENQPTPKKG